ncbi:hypothetical protein KXX35_009813, partial [Aspergillus fumigatus]
MSAPQDIAAPGSIRTPVTTLASVQQSTTPIHEFVPSTPHHVAGGPAMPPPFNYFQNSF